MSKKDTRVHEILYSTESREELAQRIAALEDSEAKLRKLSHDMMEWFEDDEYCERCALFLQCGKEQYEDGCLMLADFKSRMFRLGVEVDG